MTSIFEGLGYQGEHLKLPKLSQEESFAEQLKNDLVNIQTNNAEDPFEWRVLVEENVYSA
ncbi:hypothetical protein D3C86_1655340 [compost metagenome]